MVGAGISTAAGIPDFRSPSTGIYDNLEEYNLPHPMAVFSLDYFNHNPKPFFEVARRLYRPYAKPTTAHYFIRLLHEKGLLRRHFTQNVDTLERISGLPAEKIVEAHGSFYTGHCRKCRRLYDFEFMKDEIMAKRVPMCTEGNCSGVVKPDVVFFGESLPSEFTQAVNKDFKKCDLLIIMGTSLTVLPFCGLVNCTKSGVPRLYINREYSEGSNSGFLSFVMTWMVARFKRKPLRWGKPGNKTDVFVQKDADTAVLMLAELLGWKEELLKIQKTRNDELEEQFAKERAKTSG
ncbi:NAD-dependent protein deacetylase sirtuin-2 [Sparganum proliferum]